MANFFSLGSCSGTANNTATTTTNTNAATPGRSELQNPQLFQLENLNSTNPNPNPNLNENASNSWNSSGVLLYRNEEIYQKGFEIWQQYVQVHHPAYPPKLDLHPNRPFLLHHHMAQSGARSPVTRSMMRSSGSSGGGGFLGGGGMNCQDCGNQAKKDCAHMRCRTCCKSRGFDCPTHVKSTWVPAAQRRERQNRLASLQNSQQSQQLESGDDDRSNNLLLRQKRQREDKELAAAATTTSTGLELGQHFPAEVSAPAVFRCVRVHSPDDAPDQKLAYQTAVNIGGRLFKGILYDQGLDRHYTATTSAPTPTPGGADVSSSSGQQPHNLLFTTATATANLEGLDPNNNNSSNNNNGNSGGGVYPPQISAFLAGTQFFPPPRS